MNMNSCIDLCNHCHQTCLQTAMTHCLTEGGEHTAPDHFRLMINCSQVCQLSADLQLSNSSFAKAFCKFCADVCEACAKSCEAIENMDDCVKACRNCAASCREMATH